MSADRHLGRHWLHAIVFSVFAMGDCFWQGNFNFQIGALLFFFAVARGNALLERPVQLLFITIACFFCHMLDYAALVLMLLCMIVAQRRYRVALVFLPSMILALWYVVGRVLAESISSKVQLSESNNIMQFLLTKSKDFIQISPFKNYFLWNASSFLPLWSYGIAVVLTVAACILTWRAALEGLRSASAITLSALLVIGTGFIVPFQFYDMLGAGPRLMMLGLITLLITHSVPLRYIRLAGAIAYLSILHTLVFTIFFHNHFVPNQSNLIAYNQDWSPGFNVHQKGLEKLKYLTEKQVYFSVSPFIRARFYEDAQYARWNERYFETGFIKHR